jgi:hypothetical protein
MSPQIIPLKGRTNLRGMQPNSGDRDHSRLSCAAGEMPLGPRAAGIFSKRYRRRWPSSGIAVRHELARDFFRSEDAPPAAKPTTPLRTLRWTLSAKRACVVTSALASR